MSKTSTDEELVTNYLTTRQNDYFEQLYERYCRKVHRKCLAFTKDKAQADDLTQDIFLRLLGKLEGYKRQAKFSTWLYSITYNYCTDQIRTSRLRQPFLRVDDWDHLDLIADDIVQQKELITDYIQQALLRLSPVEQDLLQKKYQEEHSIRELAIYYSLTESAIKMRLKRSRERLRHYYWKIAAHQ